MWPNTLVGRIAAGNRNDVQVRIGGKRLAVGRIAGHLEGREGPARHSGFAITRPCGDCSRAHRRSGHWTDRPAWRPQDDLYSLGDAWGVEPARKRDSSFSRPSGANEILGENGDGMAGFLAGGMRSIQRS